MTTRADLKDAFLAQSGWAGARCQHLAGDASARSYDRLRLAGRSAVLMDAPPGQGDDPADFVAIARHLDRVGLSAPKVLAADLAAGFLLLEDLGDGVFARLIAGDPAAEAPLYQAAVDVLLHLQSLPASAGLTDFSAREWAEAAAVAIDWYRFGITADRADASAFQDQLGQNLSDLADGPRVLILRDYHAENLLWLPRRRGLARVGLLDFQLAQMGQPGYDLVSLLQDARRDVTPQTEEMMIQRFVAASGTDDRAFRRSYAVLGAQRALRIIGVFAKLCLVGGKAGYVRLIPRVWQQLQRNLAAPDLVDLAETCALLLPAPSAENLARIEEKCRLYR